MAAPRPVVILFNDHAFTSLGQIVDGLPDGIEHDPDTEFQNLVEDLVLRREIVVDAPRLELGPHRDLPQGGGRKPLLAEQFRRGVAGLISPPGCRRVQEGAGGAAFSYSLFLFR